MKNAKILVIDDDERHLKLVDAMLSPRGYEVYKVKDGESGIIVARNHKPDIILLDVMMPGKDGYAVLSALKADPLTKSIPVIMVSAVGFELNKKLAEQIGAKGYITKPLALKELLQTVESLLPV